MGTITLNHYSDANGDESSDEDAAGGEYEYYDEGLDTCRWLQVVYFAGCRSSGLGPCRWLQIDGRQLLQAAAFAKKRCGDQSTALTAQSLSTVPAKANAQSRPSVSATAFCVRLQRGGKFTQARCKSLSQDSGGPTNPTESRARDQ